MSTKPLVSAGSMGRWFARATFLPSLALNLVLERVTARSWYTAIDNTVILGALPFKNMTQELVQQAGVKAVVSMNEDYELRYLSNSQQEWNEAGVDFIQLSTTDMFEAPSQDKLRRGVEFILRHQGAAAAAAADLTTNPSSTNPSGTNPSSTSPSSTNPSSTSSTSPSNSGHKVYVHCKAGRTRSATVVACYLMQVYGLNPTEAEQLMLDKRPHVWLGRQQRSALQAYYQQLTSDRASDS